MKTHLEEQQLDEVVGLVIRGLAWLARTRVGQAIGLGSLGFLGGASVRSKDFNMGFLETAFVIAVIAVSAGAAAKIVTSMIRNTDDIVIAISKAKTEKEAREILSYEMTKRGVDGSKINLDKKPSSRSIAQAKAYLDDYISKNPGALKENFNKIDPDYDRRLRSGIDMPELLDPKDPSKGFAKYPMAKGLFGIGRGGRRLKDTTVSDRVRFPESSKRYKDFVSKHSAVYNKKEGQRLAMKKDPELVIAPEWYDSSYQQEFGKVDNFGLIKASDLRRAEDERERVLKNRENVLKGSAAVAGASIGVAAAILVFRKVKNMLKRRAFLKQQEREALLFDELNKAGVTYEELKAGRITPDEARRADEILRGARLKSL